MPERVLVAGAGVLGCWSALRLQQRGFSVLLVDPWGAGNSRSSSGGETRIIRSIYGRDAIYSEMAARALTLWRSFQRSCPQPILFETGVLWLVGESDDFVRPALAHLSELDLPYQILTPESGARRFEGLSLAGVSTLVLEQQAGYLRARLACRFLLEAFLQAGGEYRQVAVSRAHIDHGRMQGVLLGEGTPWRADHYLFACGPWLGRLFPEVIGPHLRATRQEVFFFGAPAGSPLRHLPVWIDYGDPVIYGMWADGLRGMKVADDTRGQPFDPTEGDRRISERELEKARAYLARRFPSLARAPLLESRVCQYEQSADGHFILDRHPEAVNAWILGGGSGHGFKHGPVLGELAADLVAGKTSPPKPFRLERF